MTKAKVLIFRCEEYDTNRITDILKIGMNELGVQPQGNVLLKPNAVLARRGKFDHAHTRSEFLDSTLASTKQIGRDQIKELAVGERCGITIPTRYAFTHAKFKGVIKKHRAKTYYFDEWPHQPVELTNPERLRDEIYIPTPVINTDFLINLPKFKAHPWTRMTLSLKNFIGLQDDRHRLIDHNTFLEHKIADLQDVIQPDLIAVDGIIAGQGTMLTPEPFPLGAIIMGTNSVAVDTVCAHMVNLDPALIKHLAISANRGYGPMDIEDIKIGGDYPLSQVQAKTKKFKFKLERVDEGYGSGSHLQCTVGTFPEKHSPDYCWGGCPGALQESTHILERYYPGILENMKKVRYVVGDVKEDIELVPGEKVLFAGSCTAYQGKINGKDVKIEKSYTENAKVDHHKTRHNDMILKMLASFWRSFRRRNSDYVQAKGCPVSVAEHVNYLSTLGKTPNPNLEFGQMLLINFHYWQMRLMRSWHRFTKQKSRR